MGLEIRSGKHPHEVALLVAAFVMGLGGLLFFPTLASATVRAFLPPFGHILYGGLALGSAATLTGVFWRGFTGALVERAGLVGVSLHSLGYAIAVMSTFGVRGFAFGLFMVAFAGANLVRVRQIGREIREMEATRVILGAGESGERP